jgi:ABC-type long-subunit fatty acid transport system fused permease/ATPase subunit
MTLLSLVLTLIVVGVLLWLLETYVPMDATIKRIIHAVVIIAVVLWLLAAFGVFAYLGNVRVPSVR